MAHYNFDGCLICGAMKDAERQGRSLSESELKQAFQAQEDKQQTETKQQQSPSAKKPLKPTVSA